MKLAEIEQFFESWVPKWTAWERDNVGLQVGRRSRRVKNVLVALDVTPEIVGEAIRKKIDLIVSHHPLLFRPPSSISDSNPVGSLLLSLAEHRIAVYSTHTNLDASSEGVSFALARALGVQKPVFLAPLKDSLVKLAVFVPAGYVDRVTAAMANAGAGVIGEYESCSFRMDGKGTFRGSDKSNPFLGKRQQLEDVEETRLEMIVPRERVNAVVAALKSVHPYEQVAYDLYTLENTNPNFGMGAVGDLPRSMTVKEFLTKLKKAISAESVRYSGALNQKIRRVAVCGGAGSELLDQAISAKADIFVTADVRYHPFHDAAGRIVLVDAGHWETEQCVLPVLASKLRTWAASQDESLVVSITQHSTNPIHSY
ncbi:MAG: Nif3-like dinuclear metal center hexameric protein [Bacteroidota bacterium]|jgi:dinuclear metal center YbgI/SA1388 family protein